MTTIIQKTEQEIMENWQGNEIIVSVTCVAFNHEDYMHTTLNSFLMQETAFPFEIIINDDVSTDRTVEILKEYERKYPNIIKPVFQTENQYTQGINTMALLYPFVKGKYVAFCDGDDYWTDKEKLQIQVEAMEKHPEVDLSFHPSYRDVNGDKTEVLSKHANKTTIFPAEKSILGQGDFAETAAMMFTNRLISSLPDWFKTALPGDYVSEVMGAMRGGSLYIDRTMSAYRSGIEEGWTEVELKKSTEERKESLYNIINQLKFLDNYLEKKYHKEFDQVINDSIFDFITIVGNDITVKTALFNQHKSSFSFKETLLWHLLFKHQRLIVSLKKMKSLVA